jgi:hypothetical protein
MKLGKRQLACQFTHRFQVIRMPNRISPFCSSSSNFIYLGIECKKKKKKTQLNCALVVLMSLF